MSSRGHVMASALVVSRGKGDRCKSYVKMTRDAAGQRAYESYFILRWPPF